MIRFEMKPETRIVIMDTTAAPVTPYFLIKIELRITHTIQPRMFLIETQFCFFSIIISCPDVWESAAPMALNDMMDKMGTAGRYCLPKV